jgi:hypothetical protein
MSTTHNDRIDELQAVLMQLTNSLTLSERRTSRLERIIRWVGLSITLAFGLTLVTMLQPFGYALEQQAMSPSKSVEEAIDRLAASLTGEKSTLRMIGQMMFQTLELGTRRAMTEAQQIPALTKEHCGPDALLNPEIKTAQINYQLGFYVKCYFVKTNNANPSLQDYQQAVMSAVTGTAVDLGVLVARVRDDSDLIRNFVVSYVDDSNELLQKIGGELQLLNKTLASVPVMTANVNTMTHQMGIMTADMNSMTHSMGSTMGRMGNWIPW